MLKFLNDALNGAAKLYESNVIPLLKVFADNCNLYFVSVGIFAVAITAGAISLFVRVCFRRAKLAPIGRLFLFFSICFTLDLFVCLCEQNFKGFYFKTTSEVYFFCFLKFCVLIFLYVIVAAENALSLKLRKKEALKAENAKKQEYVKICEEVAPKISNHKSIEYLNAASGNEQNLSDGIYRPDLNVGYILAVCERLKKESLSAAEHELIDDLELSLKVNDFSSERQALALNESLRKLIKKAAEHDCRLINQ